MSGGRGYHSSIRILGTQVKLQDSLVCMIETLILVIIGLAFYQLAGHMYFLYVLINHGARSRLMNLMLR
jgi:hypothetical protein